MPTRTPGPAVTLLSPGKARPAMPAPWATVDALPGAPQSETLESQHTAVEKGGRFHHYYKKHMTMLGLAHALDSSDSGSDSTEGRTFSRHRRRRPAPRRSAPTVEELREQHRREHPWVPHVRPLPLLGLDPTNPDHVSGQSQLRPVGGKQVAGFKRYDMCDPALAAAAKDAMARRTTRQRQRLEEALHDSSETSLAADWHTRHEAQAAARVAKRKAGPGPAPPHATPDIPLSIQRSPAPALRRTAATPPPASSSTVRAAGRKGHHLSPSTLQRMDDAVRRMEAGHQEGMARHALVMNAVHHPGLEQAM